MAIRLEPADRTNWREMIALKLHPEQETFVAPPIKSLAMCYVRAWGEEYDYLPFVIRDENAVVGYVTLVCDPLSADDYWIDDIMIDAAHQGKGYGRQALNLVLRLIAGKYPRCAKIRLTCFRGNVNAAALYLSVGFVKTGRMTPEFLEPEYSLSGAALDKFRA
ncbi:MAG: GNAT family N-acetyltransferase [Candidatus Binatus sp.]|uniref:GNAT family N-acetyltransferase n=1 Tax=Candidatus Binatus sp. TaxID=2811406 RepID=UPI00271D4227|nr:GNAT family N-acetyltransferase [Candidatus Binatus sp.]MDO8431547.1 GNAT family N-acetyltransferase [Candidatus Binatus sp.]